MPIIIAQDWPSSKPYKEVRNRMKGEQPSQIYPAVCAKYSIDTEVASEPRRIARSIAANVLANVKNLLARTYLELKYIHIAPQVATFSDSALF